MPWGVPQIAERYFPGSNRELRISGHRLVDLAASFGTPLFAYSRAVLEQKWDRLRSALPEEFAIAYSVKANPNRTILRFFLEKGARLEVASTGEFTQALEAGCFAKQVLFAGPGKTEGELEFALQHGVGEIHAESTTEIRRIDEIAGHLGIRARLALRVNPAGDAEGGAMRMGGHPAPFGVDEESLEEVLGFVSNYKNIECHGIHLFAGTQILDADVLLAQYRHGLAIAGRAAKLLGRPLEVLDFGGGLGIAYFEQDKELDTDRLASGLKELVSEARENPDLADTQFLIEPGRYLVGEAGIYVTRVTDVKVSRGKKYIIVDGGMHQHLAASGNLGQTIKRNFPVAIGNKLNLPAEEVVDVVGCLCTPLDVLARGVRLPKVEIGDCVCIFQSGAYARAASPLYFLSHRSPAEVWVEEEGVALIRRHGSVEDYTRDLCTLTPEPKRKYARHELEVPTNPR
jgi:diaminopimelate decarboxylase